MATIKKQEYTNHMQIDGIARAGFEQDPFVIEQMRRHVALTHEDPGLFIERTGNELDILTPIVVNEVVPHLEKFEARWHEEGFMVFTLAGSPNGSLRLHVYPAGLRKPSPLQQSEESSAGTHNHSWIVMGDVLAGYQDIIYKVSADPSDFSEEELALGSVHKYYTAIYWPGNKQELRVIPPKLVWAAPDLGRKISPYRRFGQGDIHILMPEDDFHKPTIPHDTLGATVVRISQRYHTDGPFVLLDKDAPNVVPSSQRALVSLEEKLLAKQQLLDALAPKASLWTPRTNGAAVYATMD